LGNANIGFPVDAALAAAILIVNKGKSMKKNWQRPNLAIITRSEHQMSVLQYCKFTWTQPPGPSGIGYGCTTGVHETLTGVGPLTAIEIGAWSCSNYDSATNTWTCQGGQPYCSQPNQS